MPRRLKYALCVGASAWNAEFYKHTQNAPISEDSVHEFAELFEQRGFTSIKYTGHHANSNSISELLSDFGKTLKKGDTLLIYFLGHTLKISSKEESQTLKAWALFDGVYFRYQFWNLIKAFRPGVDVIVISDSCYSGILDIQLPQEILTVGSPRFLSALEESRAFLYNQLSASVVVIGGIGENKILFGSFENRGFTAFGYALKRALENYTAKTSIQDIYDFTNIEIVACMIRNHFTQFGHVLSHLHEVRAKSWNFPRWHYVQGTEYTGLRTNREIFKPLNDIL